MFRAVWLVALLALTGCADASIIINNIDNSAGFRGPRGEGRIYLCLLTPFNKVYVDAARSERIARYKVGQRCEREHKEGSLFCRPKDAVCSTTTLDDGDARP